MICCVRATKAVNASLDYALVCGVCMCLAIDSENNDFCIINIAVSVTSYYYRVWPSNYLVLLGAIYL